MNEDLLMALMIWLFGFMAGGLAVAGVTLIWIEDLVAYLKRR